MDQPDRLAHRQHILSLRTIYRPSTGFFQIAVWTGLPLHVTSRGRQTFTESDLGIYISWKSSTVEGWVRTPAEYSGNHDQALV
ncbi:MAG: hypothetical protein JOZ48_13185 [Acidobacteriaceae bacterium]|nr:hypothetical protein [Acidobacteriaceae bacterium]